jgi:hypothetical protein
MENSTLKIAALKQSVDHLSELASQVGDADLFTEEERARVSEAGDEAQAALENESRAFDEHYNQLVSNLADIQHRITERRSVLESSEALRNNEDLIGFFAQKQVELEEELMTMVQQVEDYSPGA